MYHLSTKADNIDKQKTPSPQEKLLAFNPLLKNIPIIMYLNHSLSYGNF